MNLCGSLLLWKRRLVRVEPTPEPLNQPSNATREQSRGVTRFQNRAFTTAVEPTGDNKPVEARFWPRLEPFVNGSSRILATA